MKGLMCAIAAMTVGITFADGVTSANIVGYTSRPMQPGFRMLSIPWEQVGGEGANINKVFPYHSDVEIDWELDGAAFDASFMPIAPHIQVQRISGPFEGTYELYYYVNNAYYYDESLADTDCEGDTFIPGWCDVNGVYANLEQSEDSPGELIPGVSVWFKDPNNNEETRVAQTSGQVLTEDVDIICPAGFRLRAPALPLVMNINDKSAVTFSGLDETVEIDWEADGAAFDASFMPIAPHIQIQRIGGQFDGTYELYYYVQNAYFYDESLADTDCEGDTFIPGWCDVNGVYANLEQSEDSPGNVPVNGAFWTKGTTGSFTMTLKALK